MNLLVRLKMMYDGMVSKISTWKVFLNGTKDFFKAMPIRFSIFNIIGMADGFLVVATIFITQQMFDSIADVIQNDGIIWYAYFMIIAMGGFLLLREVLRGVQNVNHTIISNLMYGEYRKLIHAKMAKIDPVCVEYSQFNDLISKSVNGAVRVVFIVKYGFNLITFYLPVIIVMCVFLYSLNPVFIFAILLTFLPEMLSQFIRQGIIAKFVDKTTPISRRYNFYSNAIIGHEYLKETRILGAFPFFIKRVLTNLSDFHKERLALGVRIRIFETLIDLISLLGYAGILFLLVQALLSAQISIGAFSAVFGAINMLFGTMSDIVEMYARIAGGMGEAHNYIRFMELPEREGADGQPNYQDGICAENISFSYPSAAHKSIDAVSISIKAGETVAIVGENGAGKTTLVRILIGLYLSDEGRVFLNGMDTKEFNFSIFKGVSGVFQNFQRYQMTLNDNISISEFDKKSGLEDALLHANMSKDDPNFPNGFDTMLSREFGGIDLSMGQWQKIAIARGLYRNHHVIVLDEPAASIDPIEESQIYKYFVSISRDKTAIIVTHRLGSTKIADRIFVMNKGRIVETGSHGELMQQDGLYANMYRIQSAWYNN